MEDVKAFLKENEPPALSLIPDGSFPVGIAGSGSINLILKCEFSTGDILINGGLPDSPGYATAQKKEETAPFLTFYSIPRHGSDPDPGGNMIARPGEALSENSETVKILKDASNEVTGENEKPYAMAGLTYAHILPEAYVFGTDGNVPPGDFPPERGHVHGVDGAASVERLKRAMKIYSRALLRLNEKHKQGENN